MFLEFGPGTFMWQWFHSWAGLNAMTIALIVATPVIGLTKWTPVRSSIKLLVAAGVAATLPLGLARMGFEVMVYSDQAMAYLNFFGAVLAVGVGVPYLFHQILSAAPGKYAAIIGNTVGFTRQQRAFSGNSGSTWQDTDTNGDAGSAGNSSSPSANQATLIFQTGSKQGDTVSIGARSLTVGRAPDNDIVLDDPTVSRRHATITHDGTGYYVEDLGSTAGIRVNGRKIGKQRLAPGAKLQLGNTEITFGPTNQANRRGSVPVESLSADDVPEETKAIGKPANLGWLAVTGGPAIGATYT